MIEDMGSKGLDKEKGNRRISFKAITIGKVKVNVLYLLFVFSIFLGTGYDFSSDSPRRQDTDEIFRSTTKGLQAKLKSDTLQGALTDYVRDFYRHFDYSPLWTEGFTLKPVAYEGLSLLENAQYFGLPESGFSLNTIKRLEETMSTSTELDSLIEARIDYEFEMTNNMLRFMVFIGKGVAYYNFSLSKEIGNPGIDSLKNVLLMAIDEGNLTANVLGVQPKTRQYRNLLKAWQIYLYKNSLNRMGTNIALLDDRQNAVNTLRLLGYLNDSVTSEMHLSASVSWFQKQNGLKITGELDNATKRVLISQEDNLFRKIAINLERLRSDSVVSNDYLWVNIPGYSLDVVKQNKLTHSFNVVVGKVTSPTPELTGNIERMVTCPSWIVPLSIAKDEMYSMVKNDSSYLQNRNFLIKDKWKNPIELADILTDSMDWKNPEFYFEQQPGRGNALGNLKFLFPNPYNVYLHDTPSKRLFEGHFRAHSHGCVRVEQPEELADIILREFQQKGEGVSVKPLIREKITKEIDLERPVPVLIRYYTCQADNEGRLRIYPDVYDKDAALEAMLFNTVQL